MSIAHRLVGRAPGLPLLRSLALPLRHFVLERRLIGWELTGPTEHGRGRVFLAGSANAPRHYLVERFFTSEPAALPVCRGGAAEVLRRGLAAEVDLCVVRVDALRARRAPSDVLRCPEWLGTWLPLPEELSSITRSRAGRSAASDYRHVHQSDLTWEVSADEGDLDFFLAHLYRPFIRRRHGEDAVYRSRILFERWLARGSFLWVLRGGERHAGVLIEPRGNELSLRALGVAEHLGPHERSAVIAGLYWFAMSYAAEQGLQTLEIGGVHPSLRDGLWRYKRKYGAQLCVKPDCLHEWLLGWRTPNARVLAFLARTAIVCRVRSELVCVTAITGDVDSEGEAAERLAAEAFAAGLDRCFIVGADGPSGAPTPDVILRDGISPSRSRDT